MLHAAQVALAMRPEVFGPSELPPPTNFYVVKNGIVACGIKLLVHGQSWGSEIITQSVSEPYRARCLTYVDVFVISKKSFWQILDTFPTSRHIVRKYATYMAMRVAIKQIAAYVNAACMNEEGYDPRDDPNWLDEAFAYVKMIQHQQASRGGSTTQTAALLFATPSRGAKQAMGACNARGIALTPVPIKPVPMIKNKADASDVSAGEASTHNSIIEGASVGTQGVVSQPAAEPLAPVVMARIDGLESELHSIKEMLYALLAHNSEHRRRSRSPSAHAPPNGFANDVSRLMGSMNEWPKNGGANGEGSAGDAARHYQGRSRQEARSSGKRLDQRMAPVERVPPRFNSRERGASRHRHDQRMAQVESCLPREALEHGRRGTGTTHDLDTMRQLDELVFSQRQQRLMGSQRIS